MAAKRPEEEEVGPAPRAIVGRSCDSARLGRLERIHLDFQVKDSPESAESRAAAVEHHSRESRRVRACGPLLKGRGGGFSDFG